MSPSLVAAVVCGILGTMIAIWYLATRRARRLRTLVKQRNTRDLIDIWCKTDTEALPQVGGAMLDMAERFLATGDVRNAGRMLADMAIGPPFRDCQPSIMHIAIGPMSQADPFFPPADILRMALILYAADRLWENPRVADAIAYLESRRTESDLVTCRREIDFRRNLQQQVCIGWAFHVGGRQEQALEVFEDAMLHSGRSASSFSDSCGGGWFAHNQVMVASVMAIAGVPDAASRLESARDMDAAEIVQEGHKIVSSLLKDASPVFANYFLGKAKAEQLQGHLARAEFTEAIACLQRTLREAGDSYGRYDLLLQLVASAGTMSDAAMRNPRTADKR